MVVIIAKNSLLRSPSLLNWWRWAAAVLLLAGCGSALADTATDPFGTEATLERDTGNLVDPSAFDCLEHSGKLTFARAVELALCRNPRARTAWAAARSQAAALGSAESAWLPTASLSVSPARDYGQHADVSGNFVENAQNTGDATVTLAWTLYDFGGRGARIKSAHSLLDAAAATVSSVAQQTIAQVVQVYYGVVAGDAELTAAELTERVTMHSLEVARSLRDGGVGTLADVLQAETAHGQAQLATLQARAAAASARGALAVTLGLTAETYFTLDPEPVPTDVPALTARIGDLMTEATRERPDLKAAEAQCDAAEANITVARALGRPSISIGALHNFQSTTGLPNQNYDQIGLSFVWPVFTGFNTSYGVRQAMAGLQSQEANLQQVSLNVTLDVWNAYHSLESANQQLNVTADLTKTADENLDVALGRYKAGVGTIVDVLTAQTAAATARQFRINAELGWKVARAQLSLALGRLSSAQPLLGGAAATY
jgi:outer membrane protein TolC